MTEFSHALRLCNPCRLKFRDPTTLQLSVLSSQDSVRAVCGTYFYPDMQNRRPCPSCALRFGLPMKDSVCSICESTENLD